MPQISPQAYQGNTLQPLQITGNFIIPGKLPLVCIEKLRLEPIDPTIVEATLITGEDDKLYNFMDIFMQVLKLVEESKYKDKPEFYRYLKDHLEKVI